MLFICNFLKENFKGENIYIYIYIYINLSVNAVVRPTHSRSGDMQDQKYKRLLTSKVTTMTQSAHTTIPPSLPINTRVKGIKP